MAPTFGGLLWIIFRAFELQIQAGEKTLTAPIRIDLLILAPILYVFSLLGAISLIQQIRGRAGDFSRSAERTGRIVAAARNPSGLRLCK